MTDSKGVIIYKPMKASQKALSIPELVSQIFSYFTAKTDDRHWEQFLVLKDIDTLLSCARVCSIWYGQVMRTLWGSSGLMNDNSRLGSLVQRFERIAYNRRQYYADMMKKGLLLVASDSNDDLEKCNRVLQGISFTNMRCLEIFLDHSRSEICLPHVDAPNIVELQIRPCIFKYVRHQRNATKYEARSFTRGFPREVAKVLPEFIQVSLYTCPQKMSLCESKSKI
ncbi:hypothetical protein N7462_006188 [Penicillium macrosclerotiorum]|uniref:uncharacterized protein n=1 Tax=Penicillium macrosclerotiorum TaxID=303699 RepID=UPI002547043C|nr:uncharacterized protein N7462_006188 [Penicillium macrosclerotiorum]KAJ5683023.1 hypothetical protein N7462_006188 [Penicillium macrosclerotiorum]